MRARLKQFGEDAGKAIFFSLFAVLPRLLTRGALFKRIIYSLPLYSKRDDIVYTRFKQKRLAWLQMLQMNPVVFLKQNDPTERRAAKYSEAAFKGADLVENVGWKWAWFLRWMIDTGFIEAMNANFRELYNSTSGKSLIGLSQNEDLDHGALTTYPGSVRPDLPGFWAAFAFIWFSSVAAAGIALPIRRCQGERRVRHIESPAREMARPPDSAFLERDEAEERVDYGTAQHIESPSREMARPLDSALLEGDEGEERLGYDAAQQEDANEPWRDLDETTIRGIRAVAHELERTFEIQFNSQEDTDIAGLSQDQIEELERERDKFNGLLEKLMDACRFQNTGRRARFFLPVYARYMRWSMGHAYRLHCVTMLIDQLLFFGAPGLVCFFAWFNLWRDRIGMCLTAHDYFEDKNACSESGKFFQWSEEKGNFTCTACSWEFVNSASQSSTEGCMNRLLVHDRAPDVLQSSVDQIKDQLSSSYAIWDWSNQSWYNWSDTQLSDTLSSFSSAANWVTLNLSTPTVQTISSTQLSKIASQISSMKDLKEVDFSRLLLANESVGVLADSMRGLSIEIFRMDGVPLNKTGLYYYWDALPLLTNFSMQGADLSRATTSETESLPKLTKLESLSAKDSLFLQPSLDGFSYWLGNASALSSVDFSGTNLGIRDLSVLSEAVAHVENLYFDGCNLGDGALIVFSKAWADAAIRVLDFSNNEFGYNGLDQLQQIVQRLTYLSLANDDLNGAILTLTGWLANSSVSYINVAGSYLSQHDVESLLDAIFDAPVEELVMSDMGLLDSDLSLILKSLAKSNLTLKSWDLSANELTSTGIEALFNSIPDTNIESLIVSNNDLSSPISSSAWENALQKGNLQHLDLSSTKMGDNLQSLASCLQENSTLTSLSVGYNTFSKDALSNFVDNLRRESELLRSVPDSYKGSIDYQRYANAHTGQNNRLKFLTLSNIPNFPSDVMKSLCLELDNFGALTIEGITFSSDQLVDIGIDGCPAALPAGGDSSLSRELSDSQAESFSTGTTLYSGVAMLFLLMLIHIFRAIKKEAPRQNPPYQYRFLTQNRQGERHAREQDLSATNC